MSLNQIISTKYYKDEEMMLSIKIIDKNNNEETYQFFNDKEEYKTKPLLRESIERLPELLKRISNSENINFIEKIKKL